MLSKCGLVFANDLCYGSGIVSRILVCTQDFCSILERLAAGQQKALCTATGRDLHWRPDVDWWAGGASDGDETWRELVKHSRTSSSPPSGRPSEKVAGQGGRRSRMLINPFQGIREPPACIRTMLEHRYDAGTMLRVVGVHTLQKAFHSSRRNFPPSPDDIATVSRWLSPLLEPEPRAAGKANSDAAESQAPGSTQVGVSSSGVAVSQLRERGAVLLLYSLAKLKQARGWKALMDDESVKQIRHLLLQRMEQLTSSLDAQGISNSLYALALLQSRTGPLIAGLTVAVDNTTPHMDTQHLATVLWSLARLDVALPDTLLTVTRELSIRQTNAQDIANSIWALAHLDCTPKQHLQEPVGKLVVRMLKPLPAVGDERIARGHLSSFTPRHHINVLWGLSRLGLHSTALYDASASLLIPRMKEVGDQGLAMLASTFGSGYAHAREKSRLALPLLRSVGDSAHIKVLKGAIGCMQQLSAEKMKLTAKRLLAAAASGKCIRATEELDSVAAAQRDVVVPGVLLEQPVEGDVLSKGAVASQEHASTVQATPRDLHDCVHTLVACLGTIRPQVADRLLQSMQPRQKLEVLIVAVDVVSGQQEKAVLLQRMAGPLHAALSSMKPAEVTALCHVMSRVARDGVPMEADFATAVALYMWSGRSGLCERQCNALVTELRKEYKLPIHVWSEPSATQQALSKSLKQDLQTSR